MKKKTLLKHQKIANDLMYYIYTQIDAPLNLDDIATDFKIDKHYLHKIFKNIFGRNIYESIRSIRLQKASNLLLTNRYSTISQIASACGYSSQTSFIRAFKVRFGMSPTVWRNGGYSRYADSIHNTSEDFAHSVSLGSSYEIVKQPAIDAYYIRDSGYTTEIRHSWQKLKTLLYEYELKEYQLISLFHDNPAITRLDACQHVSAISLQKYEKKINLPMFSIQGGVYAKFSVEGKREDLLNFIRWIYHVWLPKSGYETTTKPPYALYRKNHYLSKDGRFDMDFFLSIQM
jgi:AraC family transcriptional regulator